MSVNTDHKGVRDVPSQILERFLEKLRESEISADVVDRLAKVLTEQKKPSERAIADALFPED